MVPSRSTESRKDPTRIPQGFHKAPQGSTRVPEMFCKVPWLALCPGGKQCVVRPPSEKPSDFLRAQKIAFSHGRNTKQNRNQLFLAHESIITMTFMAQRYMR